jgi:hypothetical protein
VEVPFRSNKKADEIKNMEKEKELSRLKGVCNEGDINGFTVTFTIDCPNNALEVSERIREVLIMIDESELSADESVEKWSSLLPKWFVSACSPEMSQQDAEKLLETPEGYAILENTWTINGFVYWFDQGMRSWYWLSNTVENENILLLKVLTYERPFAAGALKWLIEAAGGTCIQEIE